MAARGAIFPLADCHLSILQRIIGQCDKDDLFLLRLVSRRFRDAVGQQVKRLRPSEPPEDLAAKFPNLVALDMACIPSERIPMDISPLLQQLPHLRELHDVTLTESYLDEQLLPALQAQTRLNVRYVDDADVLLRIADRCSSLQCLELSGACNGLLWETLHVLAAKLAKTLVRLELLPNEADLLKAEEAPERCLLPLNTGKLEVLYVGGYLIDGDICGQLCTFTTLIELRIFSGSPVTDEGIAQLCALTRLTSLRLTGGDFSCAGIAQLSRLLRLADLELDLAWNAEDRPQVANELSLGEALSGLPSLRQLKLGRCKGMELGTIAGAHSRLTKLVLWDTGLRDQPHCLQPLTGLRSLCLTDGLRDESQLRYLSGMLHLTRLGIISNYTLAFSAVGTGWLARLTALQQLALGGRHSSIKAGALEQLSWLPALRRLNLFPSQDVQLPPLTPLERLPLEWLCLPRSYQSADELPERLRVPFLKSRFSK